MKKLVVLLAILMFVSMAAFAAESKCKGKVLSVEGDVITIEVEKGKAADLSVGAAVEMEVKDQKAKAKAPQKGGDMLQGC